MTQARSDGDAGPPIADGRPPDRTGQCGAVPADALSLPVSTSGACPVDRSGPVLPRGNPPSEGLRHSKSLRPSESLRLSEWLGCHHCDALLHESDVPEGRVARCPHCGSVVLQRKRMPVQRTLAFSLAGLMLYIPANFLPIMSFEMLGNDATNTMIKGVLQLWQQGYYWMAFLVCLCSMIMPLLELAALFTLSLAMARRRFWHWHRHLLRVVHRFSEWGMLEVYLLGILVAFIKMSDLGDIHLGTALFCFVGLLLCSMGAAMSFDPHACWQHLERGRRLR